MLAYKRSQILRNLVTCYRRLSFGAHEGLDGGMSGPCGTCALCGNGSSHNSMALMMKCIGTPNGKRRLTQKLNCKDYGIYVACSNNCDNYSDDQTMT